jgi:hypothetical protein
MPTLGEWMLANNLHMAKQFPDGRVASCHRLIMGTWRLTVSEGLVDYVDDSW